MGIMSNLDRFDRETFKSVFSTHQGRRLMSSIIDYCGVYSSTFSPDHSVMAFQEGKRSVGLMVLGLIECIDNGVEMLQLANRERLQYYKADSEVE